MPNKPLKRRVRSYVVLSTSCLFTASCLLVCVTGCSSVLSPAFMDYFASPSPGQTGTVSGYSMDNAPGHVPLFLINNTRFSQSLLDYLESTGVDISDPSLRPRVRVRVNIEYTNGNTNTVEFLDGSDIVQGDLDTNTLIVPPELTEYTLTNMVGVCDISRIEPEQVEVFVPVWLTRIEYVEGSDNVLYRAISGLVSPRFVVLEADELDDDNNVTLLRNFDVRSAPVPVNDVQCGAVVGFTISGTLTTTFDTINGTSFFPGYLLEDTVGQASNPGRFKFTTSIR